MLQVSYNSVYSWLIEVKVSYNSVYSWLIEVKVSYNSVYSWLIEVKVSYNSVHSWLIDVHLVPSPVKQVTGNNCVSYLSVYYQPLVNIALEWSIWLFLCTVYEEV
jgi:hypothetical protein